MMPSKTSPADVLVSQMNHAGTPISVAREHGFVVTFAIRLAITDK